MDASITSRPFELGTPRLDAGFLLGTSVAVLLLIYALLLPLGWPANSQMSGGPGGQALDAAAFAVVGLLIVRRQPGTSSGLILIGSAVLLLVSADAQLYLLLDYYGRDGELPLGRLAAALSPLWAGAIALAPALMMLFPDGRPISRGWRKAAWASAALTAAFLVLLALVVVSALWQEPLLVSPSGDLAVVADPSGWSGTVFGVGFACLAVALLIALTSVIERYRRVSGKQRQRLQWFLCGSALLVTTFVGRQVLVPTSEGPWALFGTIVLSVAVVAVWCDGGDRPRLPAGPHSGASPGGTPCLRTPGGTLRGAVRLRTEDCRCRARSGRAGSNGRPASGGNRRAVSDRLAAHRERVPAAAHSPGRGSSEGRRARGWIGTAGEPGYAPRPGEAWRQAAGSPFCDPPAGPGAFADRGNTPVHPRPLCGYSPMRAISFSRSPTLVAASIPTSRGRAPES